MMDMRLKLLLPSAVFGTQHPLVSILVTVSINFRTFFFPVSSDFDKIWQTYCPYIRASHHKILDRNSKNCLLYRGSKLANFQHFRETRVISIAHNFGFN